MINDICSGSNCVWKIRYSILRNTWQNWSVHSYNPFCHQYLQSGKSAPVCPMYFCHGRCHINSHSGHLSLLVSTSQCSLFVSVMFYIPAACLFLLIFSFILYDACHTWTMILMYVHMIMIQILHNFCAVCPEDNELHFKVQCLNAINT